tara:strand:+ start:11132 stop:11788 length:657 start_codon:yes stop_codon:yes gene_type:complete
LYTIILGGGKIGYSISKWLLSLKYEVTIIEKSEYKCKQIENDLGNIVINGDGTNPKLLESSGISRATNFISTTTNDPVNFVACQITKDHFNLKNVFTTINKNENIELFKSVGINNFLTIDKIIADQMKNLLYANKISPASTLFSEMGNLLLSVNITAENYISNKKISEIDLPNESFISLIIPVSGIPFIPTPESIIEPGHKIIFVTKTNQEQALLNSI